MDSVFMKGGGFDEGFVKGAIMELLQALDFVHTEVQAVHPGRMPAFSFLPTYKQTTRSS